MGKTTISAHLWEWRKKTWKCRKQLESIL